MVVYKFIGKSWASEDAAQKTLICLSTKLNVGNGSLGVFSFLLVEEHNYIAFGHCFQQLFKCRLLYLRQLLIFLANTSKGKSGCSCCINFNNICIDTQTCISSVQTFPKLKATLLKQTNKGNCLRNLCQWFC